jgi:hypothetical protein
MLEALGMAVCQSRESPQTHSHGEIEPFDMPGAYPVFVAITEYRQCLMAKL